MYIGPEKLSPNSLYDFSELVSFILMKKATYDQKDAEGFIKINSVRI